MRVPPAILGIILLSMWLAAAVLVAGVVAPAAFAVLPSRTLAGALVGRVLPVIFWAGIAVGAATIFIGRMAAPGRGAAIGAAILVVGCAIAQWVISPRIERIRQSVGGPIDALDIADPRRMDFGRLHGLSILALGVAGVGALLALALLVRVASARSST